jgi:hypothetical protein
VKPARVARWRRWARAALVAVLAALVLLPTRARATETLTETASIRLPALPPSYVQKSLGWLSLAYAPSAHERVQPLVDDADAVKDRLSQELGQPVLDRVDVRIARTADEMAMLAPAELPPPAYASGVAYASLHLVILSLTAPVGAEATDLGEVFRHELAHVALEDAVQGHHIPRWFNEGLAVYESGESRTLRVRTLWDATLSRTVVPLSDLDRDFPSEGLQVGVAYAESADFVRFLLRDGDQVRFAGLIDRARKGEPFERALSDAYGTDLRKLEFQWRQEIAKRYSLWPVLFGGSFLWVVAIALAAVGWVKKKRHARAVLARWEREDAIAAAAAAAHGASNDGFAPSGPEPYGGPAVISVLPKVEHEGDWHTLH